MPKKVRKKISGNKQRKTREKEKRKIRINKEILVQYK